MGNEPSVERGILVCPDIEPVVSPIDGTVLGGRRQLRDYMRSKNLAHADEVKPDWDREQKVRDMMYTGDSRFDGDRRKQHIQDSIAKHTRRR